MQKKTLNTLKFVFASLILILASCCLCSLNINNTTKTFANSIQTLQAVIHDDLDSNTINGFSASYKEITTDSAINNNEFIVNYKSDSYQIELTVSAENISNFGYNWYYSKDNINFSLVENEQNNSIYLTNCAQSGYYFCQVYNLDNNQDSAVADIVHIQILPKTIKLKNIIAQPKEYDATTNILLSASLEDVEQQDDVNVEVNGHTLDANAGEQKLVYIDSILLTGEDKDNYVVQDYNQPVFAKVSKVSALLVWSTESGKSTYKYNGLDQASTISAYYENINKIKVYLPFSLKGNSIGFSKNYINEFINAGAYTATAILTQEEINYNIVDDSGDLNFSLNMNKIDPVITIDNTQFTYNKTLQDAKRCATINNNEQTLKFTNNTFVTVKQGNALVVGVEAEESLNYFAIKKEFRISVSKAQSQIDDTSVVKDYVYNGSLQVINSGAVLNNNEQTLQYLNNSFTTVKQGNNMPVTLYAAESDNYTYSIKTFTISVSKARISTKGWMWNYTQEYVYNNKLQSVSVINYNKDLVYPYYVDASFINAGTYTAKVNFYLDDPDNYYPVEFDDIVWTIKKATVQKPNIISYQTTYNGAEQTFPVKSNDYYEVTNGTHKNAGTYNVCISLKNNLNVQWEGSDSENIIINWTINKVSISKPSDNVKLEYTGKEQSLNIEKSDKYEIINQTATQVGKYTTYLVLKDTDNYEWEGTKKPYIKINWEIYNNDTSSNVSFVIIIVISIFVALLAIYATLHFTMVSKNKKKK